MSTLHGRGGGLRSGSIKSTCGKLRTIEEKCRKLRENCGKIAVP